MVPTTGNMITNPNQTVTTGGTYSFLGSWYGRSFFGSASTYNLVQIAGGGQHVWGFSNSVTSGADFGAAGGGGLQINAPANIAIPTTSEVGLLLLATALAGAGVFLVRRS